MGDFVHLHLHTEYSLLDGACRIKDTIAQAKELGQSAVAITDHGVMYGVIDFYKEAKKQGIKPIIGCEVYVARRTRFDKVHGIDISPYHLVLLCENYTGYKNLTKLVSSGFIDGFYKRPRIDIDLLKQHSEGLIALSACLAGHPARLLVEGDYEKAKQVVSEYQDIFGKDSYFIEIQDHGIYEQKQINPLLVRLSNETGIDLVATNDCHYVKKEDSKAQNILVCIQTNSTIHDKNILEFPTDEFYMKSEEEMLELFPYAKQAVYNTKKIADRCEVEFEFGNIKLPLYTAPDNIDNNSFFKKLCYDGLKERYSENPDPHILKRMDMEVSVIMSMGYTDYFLIVWDFVNYAKTNNIPVGPGRGSGAGSICAYCMGITGIDPIKYNLLFERFLNPERISMPDFDIDFCYERRQEVIDYVIRKYGKDHVAQIVTFGTMAARNAIRDVGRAMGVPYNVVDKVAKSVPMELNINIKTAIEKSKELRDMISTDRTVKELVDMARKVEGMPRHASTHAAGVVITKDPVDSYVPLAKNDEAIVTQFPMGTLEELGLLKMDFLGLRTLTVLSDTEKMIKQDNPDFDIEKISIDDTKVYEFLSTGNTDGVFQFESAGMKRVLENLKPEQFEDLIAVISLYRPGPMDSIPRYIECRHDISKITYKHPMLKDILDVTYGCIVYQEQVMQIFRQLAGYSYAKADLVRRAMSKKKADIMEKERKNFIFGSDDCVGCLANGISEEIANSIFNEMSSFASYAFNKSHAAAYAIVAYRTAYLKYYYPKEYMASILTSVLDFTPKISLYISECKRMGIEVLAPDVNDGEVGFSISKSENKIRFGMLAIKNLGRGLLSKIVEERKLNGIFNSFYDFCTRIYQFGLNKRALENLIYSGALDCFGNTRRELIENSERIIQTVAVQEKNRESGQISFFEMSQESFEVSIDKYEEYNMLDKLRFERESIGFYLSSHPLASYQDMYKSLGSNSKMDKIIEICPIDSAEKSKYHDREDVNIFCIISKAKEKTTKKRQQIMFLDIEDETGSVEVLVFPQVLEKYYNKIQQGEIVLLKGQVSVGEDEDTKIICQGIYNISEIENNPQIIRSAKGINNKENNVNIQSVSKNMKPGLYLKLPSKESYNFDMAKRMLKVFEGSFPVYVFFYDKKTMTQAPRSLWINPNDVLINELRRLLGEKNVAVVLK